MVIHHGIRLYAVDSRDAGTLGGRAKRATIKIYDGSCANTPRTVISGAMVAAFRADVPGDRDGIERFLRSLLPSNDPYRLPPASAPLIIIRDDAGTFSALLPEFLEANDFCDAEIAVIRDALGAGRKVRIGDGATPISEFWPEGNEPEEVTWL